MDETRCRTLYNGADRLKYTSIGPREDIRVRRTNLRGAISLAKPSPACRYDPIRIVRCYSRAHPAYNGVFRVGNDFGRHDIISAPRSKYLAYQRSRMIQPNVDRRRIAN